MSKHSKKKRRGLRAEQRIIIFLIVLVLLLSASVVALLAMNSAKRNEAEDIKSSYEAYISSMLSASSKTSSQGNPSQTTDSSESPKQEDNTWKLRLANADNVLPNDFTVETALITPAYASKKNMTFDARAVGDLNRMLADASKDGVNLLVISSFRTINYQTNLYNNEVQKWLNQGYSEADAKKKAGTIVAVPGTSDHNLGLAVDLNSLEESFENTRQFTWLQEHAEDYGFVLRYPKDKQDITKIIYEPWHYRYVGAEDARKMNELDMCLEEYVEYLRGQGR